eukprot:6204028-Pleurochrysis_carterae.AAC.2
MGSVLLAVCVDRYANCHFGSRPCDPIPGNVKAWLPMVQNRAYASWTKLLMLASQTHLIYIPCVRVHGTACHYLQCGATVP